MAAIALLFPGQGSQEVGMGRELAEAHTEVMDVWKQAERASGVALREIYWDGDEKAMADTKHLQPALTVANYTLWMHLSQKVKPAATAGHSLGEYSALAAAGVLPIGTVIELVALRGRLMAEADPEGKGAMAALVRLSLEQVETCIAEVAEATGEMLVIANYNTPGQVVASGTKNAILVLQEHVKAHKGRALPLPVSGAFHSPLMADAAAEMGKALAAVSKNAWSKAKFPVYSNVSATGETDAEALHSLLARQMTSSVYWVNTINNQWDAGCRHFVECGPKGVLTRMVAPILEGHLPEADCKPEPAWKTTSVGNMQAVLEFV